MYCFIRCLELPDQVLFVNAFVHMLCNRYAGDYGTIIPLLTSGSISIQDYKIIMQEISSSLHYRYYVYRKAYFGENVGSLQVSNICSESFDCLFEIYGQCTSLRNSFNLMVHNNHIRRYRGIWSARFVNKAVGLAFGAVHNPYQIPLRVID